MTNERIIDKIKKLLRLAKSDNVSEAANAAAKAQQLMEAHNIEQAALISDGVDDAQEIKPHFDSPLESGVRIAPWRSRLIADLATVNGCASFYFDSKAGRRTVRREVCLVGARNDVENVRQLYAYLCSEIERLAGLYGDFIKGKGSETKTRKALASFRIGAADTVHWRLKDAQAAARKEARRSAKQISTTALARIDTAIARLDDRAKQAARVLEGMNPETSKRSTDLDWSHYAAGREAAKNIDLQAQNKKLTESS